MAGADVLFPELNNNNPLKKSKAKTVINFGSLGRGKKAGKAKVSLGLDTSLHAAAPTAAPKKKGGKREAPPAAAVMSPTPTTPPPVLKPKRARFSIAAPQPQERKAGYLYAFGMNEVGQLGLDPDVRKRNYPSLIDALKDKKFIDVAAGGMHTIALQDTGTVWSFGLNDDKALGRHTEEEEDNFDPGVVQLENGKKVVEISAGDSHSAALTDDGNVYIWGTFKDVNGTLGLLPGKEELCFEKPQLLEGFGQVTKITSGDNHLVISTVDGKMFTLGTGEQGQLARPLEANPIRRMTRSQTKSGGSSNLPSIKDIQLTPTEVKIFRRKVMDVWAGGFSTYCKPGGTWDTEVWVSGLNNYTQLGADDGEVLLRPAKSPGFRMQNTKWTQIAAGQHHVVALDENGKVYALGRGTDGRLGLGEDAPDAVSVPTLIPTLQDKTCVQVSAGLSTAYALTSEGKLYSWGFGGNLQLGTGSDQNLLVPEMLKYMVVNKKKLELTCKALKVSGGGQHVAVILEKAGVDEDEKMEVD